MLICTLYSHRIGFDDIVKLLQRKHAKAVFTFSEQDDFRIVEMDTKGGIFSSAGKLKIAYRERLKPSYQLSQADNCPLSLNLKGLYQMISRLEMRNQKIKGLFLQKITTINTEFSVIQEEGKTKDLPYLIQHLAEEFDAFLFVFPGTPISRAAGQHFLSKDFGFINDGQGNSEVEDLEVRIDTKYFDEANGPATEVQRERRSRSEEICISNNIPIYKNPGSLFVASDENVTLRDKDEVVDRAIALCFIEVKSEGADKALLADFDTRYNVMAKLTPREREFALNDFPDQQAIADANWRAESFHVLLWALGFVDQLGHPGNICNIAEASGILFSRSEEEFRNNAVLRSKSEILDKADLALRLNWACTNARIKNQPMPAGLNHSVIYERHYALNWLIRSLNQEWDDVTTDT